MVGGNLLLFDNKLTALIESFGYLSVGGDLQFDGISVGYDIWFGNNPLTTMPEMRRVWPP